MTEFEVLTAWILVATLVAIVAGPIAAVIVTRIGDDRRDARRRRSEILSTLMRTRALRLTPEHVGALNLIQMEFHGFSQVQAAYSSYVAHLNGELPQPGPAQDKFFEERSDRFIDLLHQIALSLGYRFDKRDLEKLSYAPVGWNNDENAARMIRGMAMDVMTGKQSIAVSLRSTQAPSPMFPPPPAATSAPENP